MQIIHSEEDSETFDSKEAIVKLINGTVIRGCINLKNNTRLSDLINTQENQFLIMFNCNLREELGHVLFVNKSQILWISPIEK